MHFARQAQYKRHVHQRCGVAFGSIRSSGLLRWFCVTGAALRMIWPHFFVGRRSNLDSWNGKIAIQWHEAASSALNFPCLKEVSQNCFVFDVVKEVSQNCVLFNIVKFKNWRSLAELPRLWGYQVQKLRKSRRIASISSWQIDRSIDG